MITKIKIKGYRIYKDFTLNPHPKFNLIIGGNESGKSTLIEAISLALTGRINGHSVFEELNPHWFNEQIVSEFITKLKNGENVSFPEIYIEIFFVNNAELQSLCGAINSDIPTNACPGISMRITPNPDYEPELNIWRQNASSLLPVEYYKVDWRSFADEKITVKPRNLTAAIIDSTTLRSTSGVDYHLRQILKEYLEVSEKAEISFAYRNVKASMSGNALKGINERIGVLHATLHDKPIILAMDQSARTSWETIISPYVDNLPFSMSGNGQQAAIKISLAMNRHSEKTKFIMIEEPENHLSHTSLTKLLHRIESLAGESQQLFITTHSTFVLNRLGLDSLLLIGEDKACKLSELSPETVSYFQKLPGYDTLRMALANKVVLVEGPSDEIIFERIFSDIYKKRPMECGIDVITMRSLSLKRSLELCFSLNKKTAVLRDNDGSEPRELRDSVSKWLVEGKCELFIGDIADGVTLEPQIISHNDENTLRNILNITPAANLLTWMKREKTEAALRISSSKIKINPPKYMEEAAKFIYD